MTITILLVDDDPEVRRGWRMRLALEPDLAVVGEAHNAETALQQAAATHPAVVLLDIKLPGQEGITIIRQLNRAAPGCKVVVVTIYDNPIYRARANEEGAAAFIAKQEPTERLLTIIREVTQPKK